MDWQDLLAALALVLIIEGLIPFFSPGGYKSVVAQMASMPDKSLRTVGFVLMLAGVMMLLLVRG